MDYSHSALPLTRELLVCLNSSMCVCVYVFTISFNKEEKVLQAVITKSLKRYYPQRYYVSH